MLIRLLLVLILGVGAAQCIGQVHTPDYYKRTDSIMMNISYDDARTIKGISGHIASHFTDESLRIRAAFVWVANTLEYDVANMYNINYAMSDDNKIDRPLATHKGVCINYASIFLATVQQLGIKGYIVRGYTRQNGMQGYLPHAWVALYTAGQWRLYDPTWASGYVNNGKFVRRLGNQFYDIPPKTNILTHMPFDPMWQLLNPVVDNNQFNGQTSNAYHPPFNFNDTIALWERQDSIQRLEGETRRLEQNVVNNDLLFNQLTLQRRNLEIFHKNVDIMAQRDIATRYNGILVKYNDAVTGFNNYIKLYNRQFKHVNDEQLRQSIDEPIRDLDESISVLSTLPDTDPQLGPLIRSALRSAEDIKARMYKHKDFVYKYLDKGKLGRATMFNAYNDPERK